MRIDEQLKILSVKTNMTFAEIGGRIFSHLSKTLSAVTGELTSLHWILESIRIMGSMMKKYLLSA